jgi:hypothetical protein
MLRKMERKKRHTKVGVRAFIFFIVAALALGGIAISLNLKLEDRQNAHGSAP